MREWITTVRTHAAVVARSKSRQDAVVWCGVPSRRRQAQGVHRRPDVMRRSCAREIGFAAAAAADWATEFARRRPRARPSWVTPGPPGLPGRRRENYEVPVGRCCRLASGDKLLTHAALAAADGCWQSADNGLGHATPLWDGSWYAFHLTTRRRCVRVSLFHDRRSVIRWPDLKTLKLKSKTLFAFN